MNSAVSQHAADEGPRSRTAAAATGAAVLGVCVAYVGWSLLAGRSDPAPPSAPGIELGLASEASPRLTPPPETPPVARLTLDDGMTVEPLTVMNAHLEVSPQDDAEIAPALQQMDFEPHPPSEKPAGAVGAWLTGAIEPVGSPAPPVR